MRGRGLTGLAQGDRLAAGAGNLDADKQAPAELDEIAVMQLDFPDGVAADANRAARSQPRALGIEKNPGVIPSNSALREGKIRPRPASDAQSVSGIPPVARVLHSRLYRPPDRVS